MTSPFKRVRRTVAAFAGDGQGTVLLILAVGWFFTIGVRLVYPVLVPQIRATFGVNNTVAGFLFTAMMLTYAMGQFPSGLVADRVGERFILSLSVAGTVLGVALIAAAPAFGVLLLGCVLFGLGSGLFAPPTISVLSKVYPSRAGTAHGILFASGSIGTTVLPIVAGFVAVRFGWRAGFAVVLPALALSAVGIWLLVPATDPEAAADAPPFRRTIHSVVAGVFRREILLVAGAMLMVVITFQAINSFLPTYFIEVKGLNQRVATTVFGAFFGSSFLCQIGAGVLADRWPNRVILVVIAALSAAAIYGLTVVSGIVPIVALTVVLSSSGAFISVTNTYFVSTLPDDIQGGGVGLLRSAVIGVGATSPIAVGYLADLGQFDLAFRLLAGCLLAAVAILAYSLLTSGRWGASSTR